MGNEDSVPIFRGYVKQINTTDDKMTITANDPRIFLTGKDSFPVSLTENENYDGFTLTQFLFDFIKEKINNNYTLIGTEYMNEIDRPAFLTDIRQDEGVPYDLVQGQINSMYDAENPLEVFGYSIGILHGADSSSIIFIKQKNIDEEVPVCTFSYGDGIVSLKYKERAPPSFGIASGDGFLAKFEYGNAPRGKVGLRVQESFEDRAKASEVVMAKVITAQKDTKEINMQVSKGYYYALESLINIDVPDTNIYGVYRITSKNISYSGNSLNCSLGLNKKPVTLTNYIL